MVGCGRPANPACGGEQTTSEPTPAICAGTTFITTVDGYTASPPGAYSPTRSTGTHFSVTVPPSTTVVVTSVRRCPSCTLRARVIDSSSAARTAGSSWARAWVSRSRGTRTLTGRTLSNFSVYSKTASTPRSRTASTTGRT